MASTVRELFDAALRQHARLRAGKYLATFYIGVPHQLPPKIMDSSLNPPDREGELADQYVRGDHDFHACIPLIDGLTYQGHQAPAVRTLAARHLRGVLGADWMERVLCKMYAGSPMHDPDYRRLADGLAWDDLWPVVDAEKCLTGEVVESEEGYANVLNEAMMREDVARAAGFVVADGFVHIPGGA